MDVCAVVKRCGNWLRNDAAPGMDAMPQRKRSAEAVEDGDAPSARVMVMTECSGIRSVCFLEGIDGMNASYTDCALTLKREWPGVLFGTGIKSVWAFSFYNGLGTKSCHGLVRPMHAKIMGLSCLRVLSWCRDVHGVRCNPHWGLTEQSTTAVGLYLRRGLRSPDSSGRRYHCWRPRVPAERWLSPFAAALSDFSIKSPMC